jgi:hypothetical protein
LKITAFESIAVPEFDDISHPNPLPTRREYIVSLVFFDWGQWLLRSKAPIFNASSLLRMDVLEQFRRRFVPRVLFHEFSPHGEVEDEAA